MFSAFDRLKNQSLWYYCNFGTNALFILVFQKIFIMKLGYAAFGDFSFYYSIFSFLVLFSDLVLSQRAAGWLITKKYSEEELLSIRSTFAFISFVILCVWYFKFHQLSLGYAFFVLASILQATWLFQFNEKMHQLGFVNLISKILFVGICYRYPDQSINVFGFSYAFTFILSAYYFPKLFSFKIDFKLLKRVIKDESILLFGRVLAYFYTSFLSVLWFYFYGAQRAGELSASYRLYQQFSILISPMVSIYILKYAKGHFHSIKSCFNDKLFNGLLFFYLVLWFISYSHPTLLTNYFLKNSDIFNQTGFVFALLPIISIFSSLTLNVLLLGRGKNNLWLIIMMLTFILSLILQADSYIFNRSAVFIAFSVVLVETFALGLGAYYVRK
jgi:hypothetical protein